jgi:hypothetical protein
MQGLENFGLSMLNKHKRIYIEVSTVCLKRVISNTLISYLLKAVSTFLRLKHHLTILPV